MDMECLAVRLRVRVLPSVYYFAQWVWICTMGLDFFFLSRPLGFFAPVFCGILWYTSRLQLCKKI
ncbi:hypothetical protein DFH07DRAFT_794854 [Mycena maculata]|uniref:Uncharacterized protein n=1 Tax=Mycena maculata TaxID=230809 RepID=A0AAD7K8Q4_9AGAR|nr:hypothetical protein DFH07DRAFT_794854 [Mycena maculata]